MQHTLARDPFRLIDGPGGGGQTLHATRMEAGARLRFGVARALVQGRISFHYQPVVRAHTPHMPAFHEMLARMTMPDGQVLPASAFLPAIEESELGRAIDRLALIHALRALAAAPGRRLSVNVSPRSMGDEEWLGILTEAHRAGTGVCRRLILEITEDDAFRDAGLTREFCDHVRALGPALALDDFGAGATGFRHFRDFRFDIVKIDGAFAHGVHRDRDAQMLVRCLMRLARHFEMMSVAECVETRDDADWLAAAGIDCLQGYLIGRPAPVAEMPQTEWPERRVC